MLHHVRYTHLPKYLAHLASKSTTLLQRANVDLQLLTQEAPTMTHQLKGRFAQLSSFISGLGPRDRAPPHPSLSTTSRHSELPREYFSN